MKTITADNGTEVHQYKAIEQSHQCDFLFRHPLSLMGKGNNENVNGLIRQYLPKHQSMAQVTQRHCDTIAYKLNTRPRNRYNFKTSEEVFYAA